MSKYKNCPSCNAEPEQLKAPGVRYSHAKNCKIGRVIRNVPAGVLSDKYFYMCNKCPTTFTLKDYDNPGDSHTKECPICWATIEAQNK